PARCGPVASTAATRRHAHLCSAHGEAHLLARAVEAAGRRAVSRRSLHGARGQPRSGTAPAVATDRRDRGCPASQLAPRRPHANRETTARIAEDRMHGTHDTHERQPPAITTAIVRLAASPSRLSASLQPRSGLTALTGSRSSRGRHYVMAG